MPVSEVVTTVLDPVRQLQTWKPDIGDLIFYTGWVRHWFGHIVEANRDRTQVKIIKSTSPHFLFSMGPSEQEENSITIDVSKIKGSRCKYAVTQIRENQRIWYV